MIDDGVAQHPVEPRDRRLRILERQSVQATREGFLQDVLSGVAMAYATLEKREKRAPILDEHGR